MTRPFKPSGNAGEGGGAQAEFPPGDYLIALTWFARRQSKKAGGGDYLRTRFVIAAGPHAHTAFYTVVSLNVDKEGARRRLELWMEAIEHGDEIDLDSDTEIRETFVGRAFKATIERSETQGQDGRTFVNYDIARIVFPRLYTERDLELINEFEEEWDRGTWQNEDPASPSGGGGRRPAEHDYSDPQFSPGSPLRDDDDIPF